MIVSEDEKMSFILFIDAMYLFYILEYQKQALVLIYYRILPSIWLYVETLIFCADLHRKKPSKERSRIAPLHNS